MTTQLSQAVTAYLQHLEAAGKSASTCGTAGRTLDLLVASLGESKDVAKILPVHVGNFFKSEAATKIHGRTRAPASIAQIRRIVRQFLEWAAAEGLAQSAPLPKDERKNSRKAAASAKRHA